MKNWQHEATQQFCNSCQPSPLLVEYRLISNKSIFEIHLEGARQSSSHCQPSWELYQIISNYIAVDGQNPAPQKGPENIVLTWPPHMSYMFRSIIFLPGVRSVKVAESKMSQRDTSLDVYA